MTATGDESTLMQGNFSHHADVMRQLVNNKDFSDVKFVVGHQKEVISGHQAILAAHCHVFKAMFLDTNRDGEEPEFCLVDMKPNIFLAMLEYIYTNCVTLSSDIVIDVLAASLEYGLDDLRELSVAFLVNNLDAATACDVMQASVTFNQNDLKATAMTYINDNTKEVLEAENFKDLSEDALVTITSSSKLIIDELDIISALRKWAAGNAAANNMAMNQTAREAIKQLRLPLLSLEELADLEEENKKDNFIPADKFSEAREILQKAEHETVVVAKRRGTTHRDHHKNFGV